MRLELRRLVLVKRYLWGSLVVAIAPLLLLAFLYDRYSTGLLDTLVTERTDAELEATSIRMTSFLDAQVRRLENLADLPDVGDVFSNSPDSPLSSQLLDFLYLATGSPDIYGVVFFDAYGNRIRSVPPASRNTPVDDLSTLPSVVLRNVEVIGPVLPSEGRPGWFLLRMGVMRDGGQIGAVALKARLSSLTELAGPLHRQGVFTPRVTVGGGATLSAVGTVAEPGETIANSRQFLPGWRVSLHRSGADIEEPRERIRHALLIVVIVATIGVVWLFVHMSERLARMVVPLNEGAKSIARGDFSVRVSEDGPGELKSLAHSFNEMSGQLQSMIESRVDMDRRGMLGNLAAGIAHEIRNPLTTVKTSIHGLMRTERDPEKVELFRFVIDEIMRIDDLIEEFLTYARPREPNKEPTRIRDALTGVETLVSSTAQKSGVKLTLMGDSSLVLYVDPGHLRQILMNLALNAIQAMTDGGFLTLRTQDKGAYGEIIVKDTGTGISADDLKKVQTPFFTTRKRGTGLGLAICRELVRANEGALEIESEPGAGTVVTLTFPKPHGKKNHE